MNTWGMERGRALIEGGNRIGSGLGWLVRLWNGGFERLIGRLSTWLDASGQSTLSPDLQAGLVAAARARLEGTLRENDLR